LNLLIDIGKLNIPGLQVAYGTTEVSQKQSQYRICFLESHRRGWCYLERPGGCQKAISKYVKIEDAPTLDGTYEAFAPYWALSLAVRPEAIRAQFDYLDEKEFPTAKNADPREFFDNSFVVALEKAGFFQKIEMK
jgi:hypothetical protein